MKRVDSRRLEVEPASLPASAWLDYRAYHAESYTDSWNTLKLNAAAPLE
jgi:hypothetical protein